MRYDLSRATSDWRLVEVVKPGGRRPCSDVYAKANDRELGDVFEALRLLRASGFPPDRTKGNPEIEIVKYQCPKCHSKTAFGVLKAKPSGYRLYFKVRDQSSKEVVFLFAVNKKKN